MEALTIVGSFRGASSYDHQVREITRAFYQQGVRIQLIDFAYWSPLRLSEVIAANFITSALRQTNGKLNMKARNKMLQNFTWEKTAERLITILNESQQRTINAI